MICPHCHRSIPVRLLRSEGARALAAKRKTHGGPPKSTDRCQCGRMTAARAANARRRFKIGDRVSIRQPQLTGAVKRPPYYLYGTIVERPVNAPHPPMHGGFHYVLIDGCRDARMAYAGRLHHLDSSELRGSTADERRRAQ